MQPSQRRSAQRPWAQRTITLATTLALAAAAPALGATPTKLSVHAARHQHRHKPRTKIPAVAAAPARAPAPTPPVVLSCADSDLTPDAGNVNRVVAATLCLVNRERAIAGIGPLRQIAAMATAAQGHSLDMVLGNYVGQLSRAGSDPISRLTQTGYVRPNTAVDVAENVDADTGTASTPAATVATWMSTPGARAIILTAGYTDTGIGVIPAAPALAGPGPGATYTEDFGASS